MNPVYVLGTREREKIWESAQALIDEYARLAEMYPSRTDMCLFLCERVRSAAEHLDAPKTHQPINGGWDESVYDWLDGQREREYAAFDGDFPLGNEPDAKFASRYFSPHEIALIQCRLAHLVKAGHYAEPAYDVLIRKGFLAEMLGDKEGALACYEGVPLPSSDVKERISALKKGE